MKTGDVLIAINPCIMDMSRKATLTVGKQYVITIVRDKDFCIIDNEKDPHWFNIKGVPLYTKFFTPATNSEIYY